MNVLIIDNSNAGEAGTPDILSFFTDDTFNLIRARQLSEAVGILARDPFDLILLELDLPDSRGIKTLQTLKMRAPEIPIIILTSEKQETVAQQALREGAQDYLVREEINVRYLFRTLRYAIERHQLDQNIRRSRDELERMVADRTKQLGETNEQLKKENEVRKRKERDLRMLNRLLRVMTECNQALDHAKNEQEFLTWICEVLVFTGGYPFTWIGLADPGEKNRLMPIADAGFATGTLDTAAIVREDTEHGTGPGSVAMHSKKACILQNLRKDPRYTRIREEAKTLGYASAIGLPILRDQDQQFGGSLVILSRTPAAFEAEERKILSQLSDDISFGIRAMRTREAHEVAEEALHDSEMFYRTLINTLPVGITVVDTDDRLAFLSKKSCEMLSLPAPEDGLGTPFQRWLASGSPDGDAGKQRILKGSGSGVPVESSLMRYDGSTFWAELRSASLRDTAEQLIGTLVVTQDITERKRAEENLQKAYGELEIRVRERTADLSTANAELKKEIARREQLMAALRESEQSLRNKQRMLDGAEKLAHIGSWERELISGNYRWSDEHFRIYGYEPHSIMPNEKIFTSALHPEDRVRVIEAEKGAISGRNDYDLVFRIIRPDGTIRFIHLRGEVKRDDSGRPVGIRGSAQDITERKKAEEELARLATIVAQSDDAIIGANPDASIFSWNAGAEEIFGYSSGEAAGQNVASFVAPRRNTKIRQNLDLILAGEPLRSFESLCRKKDGSHFYASLTISPVRDENGAMSGVILIARNITERRRIQDALKESEQKYRTLFETMAQPVITIDPRGNIVDSNPAAERFFKLTKEQLREMTALGPDLAAIREDRSPLANEAYPWMRAFRTGTEVRDIIGIQDPAGETTRWVITYATPNYQSGERAPHRVSVTFNDITDLKVVGDTDPQGKNTSRSR